MIKHTDFYKDLERGHKAELIALQILQEHIPYYSFAWVGNRKEFKHLGDIIGIRADGKLTYFEVKDDSRISKYNNVLCEESVYFYDTDELRQGFMYNNYEIYCVLSQDSRKLYIFDFQTIRKLYKQGEYKKFEYDKSESDTYLLPLGKIKKSGGLLQVIEY